MKKLIVKSLKPRNPMIAEMVFMKKGKHKSKRAEIKARDEKLLKD